MNQSDPQLESGDPDSVAEEIVDLFYDRLVRFAGKKLSALPPQVADAEGAVVSALRSFFSAMDDGRIQQPDDDNDLWRLLATFTARKAVRQLRLHFRQRGEADRLVRLKDIQQVLSNQPSFEDELMLEEDFDRLLKGLGDETLQEIVTLRLAGWDTTEIANKIGIHVRSVQRKLQLIRTRWLEQTI